MIGSLVLFAVWEVLDAVLTGKFTMFFVRYICCCCCVPEVIDQQNDFLEQIKALEKLGSSYDKKIAN
jgi:predicted transcriptional regulator